MSLDRLSNPTFGTLIDRIIGLIEESHKTEIMTCGAYLHMVAANQAFTTSYNQVERSTLTPAIKKIDKRRCQLLKSIFNLVKSELESQSEKTQQAAIEVDNVLKSEGTMSFIAKESMSNRTKIIGKLLNNLNSDATKGYIAQLNATAKVEALVAVHGEFETLHAHRSSDKAKASTITSATDRRQEVKKAYNSLIKYMDSMATVTGDPMWQELLTQIKERIDEVSRNYRPKPRSKKETNK